MRIIILGGNQVGGTLAEHLVHEDHDVVVIDHNEERLQALRNRLDIQTINGSASHPNILEVAGAEDADLLIAVTNDDEVNLVACQAAYSLFTIPTKIARIRATEYLAYPKLFGSDNLPVDVFISPEQLITDYVEQLIAHPGALQVLSFADRQVKLVAVKPPLYGGPLVNKSVADVHKMMKLDTRIVAIYQNNTPIMPQGETMIGAGDELFFIAESSVINQALQKLGCLDQRYKQIMIAGGGNIGLRIAKTLERKYQIKVIENDRARTERIARELDVATVLHGDANDRDILLNENIERIDLFCAVTNDDENNIMSCMLAKRLGARKVLALITHTAYVDLLEGANIDIVISPQQATTSSILRYIRRGDIVNVHSLRRGTAEAIEIIAHGDKNTSKVVGRRVDEISLPPGSMIGAVVRGDRVMMAHGELVIKAEDHVILFVIDKKRISQVERLFEVSLGFFAALKK
ncbi:MAG: Trk system potassium transporter TrkA [Gammaproteobacteria bacterium]|nr:Trk system potassium transporter TrkA [Gammaproteobacteria bacterium]